MARRQVVAIIVAVLVVAVVAGVVVSARGPMSGVRAHGDPDAVVADYVAAWNDHDVDAFLALTTEEYEFAPYGDVSWPRLPVAATFEQNEELGWRVEALADPVMFDSGPWTVAVQPMSFPEASGAIYGLWVLVLVADDDGPKVAAHWEPRWLPPRATVRESVLGEIPAGDDPREIVLGGASPPVEVRARQDAVAALLDDYLAAWNAHDADAFRTVTTREAAGEVGWLGEHAWSPAQVRAIIENGEAIDWHIRRTADPVVFGSPAVWVVTGPLHLVSSLPEHDPPDGVDLLGTFVVVEDAGALKVAGQWTASTRPLPLVEWVTGTVDTPTGPVEIRNGSLKAEQYVRWAFERFTAVGRPGPAVASITFDAYNDRCGGGTAVAHWSAGRTRVLVCMPASFGRDRPSERGPACPGGDCADLPLGLQKILLHELGHAWLATHEVPASREAFMALVGSPTWDDPSTPHDEQGVERAANTLAWGLSGLSMESVGWTAPCKLLTEAFHLLTGVDPPVACR